MRSESSEQQAGAVEILALDPKGRVLSRRALHCNSWLKQMARIVLSHMREVDMTVTNTAGVDQTIESQPSQSLAANAGASVDTFGLVFGTSSQAPDRDDINLVAKIAHGAGAGQLEYGAGSVSGIIAISGGYRVTISRSVTNSSGGAITVNEIGIAVRHSLAAGGTGDFLVWRDLVAPGETIPDTESRTFRVHLEFLA